MENTSSLIMKYNNYLLWDIECRKHINVKLKYHFNAQSVNKNIVTPNYLLSEVILKRY